MYAVIFKATIKALDKDYATQANSLRDKALSEYGCIDFTSCTEGNREIAISYWPSFDHIRAWRNDPEHLQAQKLGKEKWYETFEVNITQVIR